MVSFLFFSFRELHYWCSNGEIRWHTLTPVYIEDGMDLPMVTVPEGTSPEEASVTNSKANSHFHSLGFLVGHVHGDKRTEVNHVGTIHSSCIIQIIRFHTSRFLFNMTLQSNIYPYMYIHAHTHAHTHKQTYCTHTSAKHLHLYACC